MFHWQLSHTFFVMSTSNAVNFRYGIDDVMDIWNDLCWYCWLVFMCWYCWPLFLWWYCCLVFICWYWWLVFLWVFWRLFGPLWCWNVFTKLMLTMGSIIEWDGFMSMSAVYRVSNISYILGVNMLESWSLCGWRSNLPNYISK